MRKERKKINEEEEREWEDRREEKRDWKEVGMRDKRS